MMVQPQRRTLFVVLRLVTRVSEGLDLLALRRQKGRPARALPSSYRFRLRITSVKGSLSRSSQTLPETLCPSPEARVALEVVGLENYSYHRGQRALLSRLPASDLKSEDFWAETQKVFRNYPKRLTTFNSFKIVLIVFNVFNNFP